MRKEIFYAIAAGVLFGLVVAFGVWKANSSLKNNSGDNSVTSVVEDSSPVPSSSIDLTIAKPLDGQVATDSTLTVSGITKPDSWVAISGENIDYITMSNTDGSFEQDIELADNLNQILVTSFDNASNSSIKQVYVVYSKDLGTPKPTTEETPEPNSDEVSSTSSDIRKKVDEKIEKVMSAPKFYMGSITDVSLKTIQIRNLSLNGDGKSGEIRQISVSDQTVYKKVGSKDKELTMTDLAIGDFVIAVGYVNSNSVLEANQLIVTDEPQATTRSAVYGKISDLAKGKFNLLGKEGSALNIKYSEPIKITYIKDGKTQSLKTSSLEDGDNVIVLGTMSENDLVSRRIHIVELAPTPQPTTKSTTQ